MDIRIRVVYVYYEGKMVSVHKYVSIYVAICQQLEKSIEHWSS